MLKLKDGRMSSIVVRIRDPRYQRLFQDVMINQIGIKWGSGKGYVDITKCPVPNVIVIEPCYWNNEYRMFLTRWETNIDFELPREWNRAIGAIKRLR